MVVISMKLNQPYEIVIDSGLLGTSNTLKPHHPGKHRDAPPSRHPGKHRDAMFIWDPAELDRRDNLAIITDQNLLNTYARPLQQILKQQNRQCHLLSFEANEANKSREQKQQLEDQLFELGCGRDTTLIALGGGVTTDLAGFIAATFCRGVPVIYVPTSLLAMVDASIGGKTGVNTSYGKNLIGSFYQPQAVFIDPEALQTLPKALFYDGIAEVIKHALLADTKLFDFLHNNSEAILNLEPKALETMIERSLLVKQYFVEQDEKEQSGPRKLLNLGHTIAHALEKISNHQISHGQAVALGLVAETKLAIDLGYCQPQLFESIIRLLTRYHLPTKLKQHYPIETCIEAMRHDKKNQTDSIHFCFLADSGKPYLKPNQFSHAVNEASITHALNNSIFKFC